MRTVEAFIVGSRTETTAIIGSMHYMYHAVPEKMTGSHLMPLNQLRESNPELYAAYAQKYKGREEIMQRRIPLLGCLWNDAVQLLPVHPKRVFQMQVELGIIPRLPDYQFYEFESSALDPAKTVVFFKNAAGAENELVKWYAEVDPLSLIEIPEATIEYYKQCKALNELPFNYQFIPHILHAGTIDVSSARIITVSDNDIQ